MAFRNSDPYVAVGDRAMVSLKKQGALRHLGLETPRVTGGPFQFDISVDHLAVEDHFQEAGVGRFFALGIETGSLEADVQGLPLAGRPGRVGPWGRALVGRVVVGHKFRTGVNTPAIGSGGLFLAATVPYLNLVETLQFDLPL